MVEERLATPRQRVPWWKRALRRAAQGLVLICAVAACAWLVRPGLASDFGIVHFPVPKGKVAPLPHKHIFPGPKFWREGPPHFSALQTTAVQVWEDVKVSAPDLAPVENQIQQIFTNVDQQTTGDEPPPGSNPPPIVVRIIYHWVPLVPHCLHRDRDCKIRHHCPGSHDNDKDDTGCPKPPPGAVPEPEVWLMLLLGCGLVGARLRAAQRSARSATSSR